MNEKPHTRAGVKAWGRSPWTQELGHDICLIAAVEIVYYWSRTSPLNIRTILYMPLTGFHDIRNETNINGVKSFSTFDVIQ